MISLNKHLMLITKNIHIFANENKVSFKLLKFHTYVNDNTYKAILPFQFKIVKLHIVNMLISDYLTGYIFNDPFLFIKIIAKLE